jgi:hypothetical protein
MFSSSFLMQRLAAWIRRLCSPESKPCDAPLVLYIGTKLTCNENSTSQFKVRHLNCCAAFEALFSRNHFKDGLIKDVRCVE